MVRQSAVLFVFFCLIFCLPAVSLAIDDPYDAPGLDPNRDTFSLADFEHIDPFTGGLTLTFEDVRVPGNGGLDLVVQRTYNSKNVCPGWVVVGSSASCAIGGQGEDTWVGLGWSLHFGRLHTGVITLPSIIELPDGSRHEAYKKIGSTQAITKGYVLLEQINGVYVATFTDGRKITFGHYVGPVPYSTYSELYATRIEDVHGNAIEIAYKTGTDYLRGTVDYIREAGSPNRQVTFQHARVGTNTKYRLSKILRPDGKSIDFSYSYKSDADRVVLGSVNPPEGDAWQFSYTTANRLYEMSRVTTPTGGNINYSFGLSPLNWGIGYYKGYRTVVQRTAAGRDIPAGTWTFSYFQAPNHEYTLVSDPCGRSIKYRHFGFDSGLPDGRAWKIGLPISREIVGQEKVDYTWVPSQAISYDNYSMGSTVASDTEIYVPYPSSETITREGQTYTTTYSNYDAYGNPGSIVETGDKTRTRSLTYWYNTAQNIVKGKPATETVVGNLPGTFTTNYYYDSSNGNLLRVDRYGANTYYQYASNGNLTSVKDPNGNFTYYQWSNGAVSRISNSVYAVNRTINSMGLTTNETNGRGHTSSFTYDGNLRLTGITPPVGNPTTITYPADNSYKQETRGGYTRTTYYDGIGRLSGTEDSKGVVTDVAYTACGLKDYTTSNIGDTVFFDNFGRIRDVVHQDNTALHYTYAGSTATVKDEALNTTVLTYNAFGNPDEKMLMAVKDATNATTSYTRNILGSLTGITQGATTRSFVYDSRSYLQSETHPESGTTTYTRYPMGQLMTRTDAAGTVSYAYDGLNRLTTMTYGSNQIGFGYDNADNRTTMTSPGASATFAYDEANLMTGQTTTVAGRTYTTAYTYDNNDNLIQQANPTGLGISFGYNSNNQVTSASGFSGGLSAVQYNTAGLPTSFTYSNTVPSLIAYNIRNLTTRTTAGTALDLGYGYDSRGNTTAIADYLDSTRNQSFGYDSLNRLTAANGSWGTGAFAYNPNGDRQTKTMAGIATSYTYASNRLASAAGGEAASYTYAGNGRLTGLTQNGSTNTLDYDTLNNLLAYKQGATTIASYGYDGDGRRVTKTAGSTTTVYHYDKAGRVISETAQDGAIKADYVFLNDRMAAKVTPLENYQCPAGLAYNAAADRCEATPACPAGGSYSPSTDRCESPVITDYQCSVTGLIFGNQAACTSACSQTAACTQTPATSASGTAPVYYDGSWSYTNATGSGNKIIFVSYQCSSDSCLPWSTASITLSGATASGSAYIKGSVKSPATNVTASGSTITFSGGDSSGTITLSGATVTGSGIINGGPGFANVTIGGSGNKINFSGGLSSGSLTLTSTAPPYTCPLGSYSCTGTPLSCTKPVACTALYSCTSGYTYGASACSVAATCPSGSSLNAATDRCEHVPAVCPAGYAFSAASGRCEASPLCPSGGTYHTGNNRCESAVTTRHQCPSTGLIFDQQGTCAGTCTETAGCNLVLSTAAGSAGTYYDGGESYITVSASGSTITLFSYKCDSKSGCQYFGSGSLTLTNATASGSATIKGTASGAATTVTGSSNKITFSGGGSSGSITLSGATVSGSGVINGNAASANVTISGSGNKINFSGGLSSGFVTLTKTPASYSCPLGGGYACAGSPVSCTAPKACTPVYSCSQAGYTYASGACTASASCSLGGVLNTTSDQCEKMAKTKEVYFYHTDPAGTPLAMTNDAGVVVWRADYKPFGEEQSIQGTKPNTKMFIGKEKDAETGLYYFGARYMQDKTARFISVDPVGPVDTASGKVNEKMLANPQKLNRYAYAINNPYRYVDPDGRDVWSIGFGSSYFLGNIGHQARKDQHGNGKQAGFGIAYDTKTGEFFTFGTGGKADSDEGKVLGVNVGVGIFVGQLKGDKQDFLGQAQEESVTPGLFTITSVETENGKKGTTFSFGGRGFGLSYTSIMSDTFDLKDRLTEKFQRNEETKKP